MVDDALSTGVCANTALRGENIAATQRAMIVLRKNILEVIIIPYKIKEEGGPRKIMR